MQPLHYSLMCIFIFGMTTVRFLSKLLESLMRNYFPKRTSGAPLHTLPKLYDVPVGFVSPSFEAVYCYICDRRRMAVARYRMNCLVLDFRTLTCRAMGIICKPSMYQCTKFKVYWGGVSVLQLFVAQAAGC